MFRSATSRWPSLAAGGFMIRQLTVGRQVKAARLAWIGGSMTRIASKPYRSLQYYIDPAGAYTSCRTSLESPHAVIQRYASSIVELEDTAEYIIGSMDLSSNMYDSQQYTTSCLLVVARIWYLECIVVRSWARRVVLLTSSWLAKITAMYSPSSLFRTRSGSVFSASH